MNLQKEENPFMGYRAVRYCLNNPDQYKVQLTALLRASAFGDIKIMVPLVTNIDEIRQVKALVEECKAELDARGVAELGRVGAKGVGGDHVGASGDVGRVDGGDLVRRGQAEQLRQLAGRKAPLLQLRAHGAVKEKKVVPGQRGLKQPSTLIAHHEPPR